MISLTSPVETWAHRVPAGVKLAALSLATVGLFAVQDPWPLALALAAWLVQRGTGAAANVAGWSFVGGVALFSGSLYLMAVTGQTKLGAITPLGGLLFLVGWGAVMVAGLRLGTGGH